MTAATSPVGTVALAPELGSGDNVSGDLAGLLQMRLHAGCDPTCAGGCTGWGQADRAADRPQAAQPPGAVRAAKCRAAGGRLFRPRADLHGDCQEVRGGTEHSRQVDLAGQAPASGGLTLIPVIYAIMLRKS